MTDATDFSLTRLVVHQAADLDTLARLNKSTFGQIGSHLLLLVTVPTSAIDAVAHAALGVLTLISGLGFAGSVINLFVPKASPITITSGLTNLVRAVQHAVAAILAPLLGLLDPQALVTFYTDNKVRFPPLPVVDDSSNDEYYDVVEFSDDEQPDFQNNEPNNPPAVDYTEVSKKL